MKEFLSILGMLLVCFGGLYLAWQVIQAHIGLATLPVLFCILCGTLATLNNFCEE